MQLDTINYDLAEKKKYIYYIHVYSSNLQYKMLSFERIAAALHGSVSRAFISRNAHTVSECECVYRLIVATAALMHS